MFSRFLTAIAAALVLSASASYAATPKAAITPKAAATPAPKPHGAEVAFVSSIQQDLMARFPTATDAEKAGYFRYTNEDNTGAISYTNLKWASADSKSPSQLWYDVNGNLLGADFSVLQSDSPKPPHLWGINPARWQNFEEHVHFVVTDAAAKESYGGTSMKKFVAAGGDPKDPQAAAVVKMGKAKDEAAVSHVFVFPAVWDLIVWVKENPNGAFAEKNPLVKPSATAEKDSM
ncbi:MAG: hypothetical protein M3M96_04675 [Candidatus Eremiobacteraeota bacterium]|nr:hypothetical protein [Candidatus Eremiobacteraeota bacterium]